MNELYWYRAYVTKVYDGDTITIDIDLGFNIKMSNIKMRLAGINTPEVRGGEREQGLISRDWLSDKILNKWISINTVKDTKGKYGRYLGYVHIDGLNLNEELVKEGLAEKYGK